MLHEVYAPRTVADVAWSRQKTVALATAIQQIRGRGDIAPSAPPHILLLHGPPGCGKLETLKVLLREDATLVAGPASTAQRTSRVSSGTTSPLGECQSMSFHVFHTCEATVHAYAQYLHRVVSYCRGQLGGGELQLPSLSDSSTRCGSSGFADTRKDAVGGSAVSTAPPTSASIELPANHAHIVKFYGEPASHALHRCTLLFLREYEELRVTAQLDERQQESSCLPLGPCSDRRGGRMAHLRRNLIFFIHTTHDTHSDKLDLNTSFPASLLQSSAVELFHCTPITEINLRKRLRSVLDLEARRQRQLAADTAMRGCGEDSTSSFSFIAPLSASLKSARRHSRAKGKAPPAAYPPAAALTAPSSVDLVDSATLNAIVASSQGDIRQALLQVQWTCLLPASASLTLTAHQNGDSLQRAREHVAEAAAAIWLRLEKRRSAARERTLGAGAGTADGRALSLSDTTGAGLSFYAACSELHAATASLAAPTLAVKRCKDKDNEGEIDSECDSESFKEAGVKDSGEVISISSASSDLSASPARKAPRHGEGKTSANGGGPASRKRARQSSPLPAMNMLSLLDSQAEGMEAVAYGSGRGTLGVKNRRGRLVQGGSPPSPAAAESEQRALFPMTRDEYLGLSHAVGRLLTQKYSIDEVLNALNVPPRKILDYLTNNQIRYFGGDQISPYAHCIEAASDADALRASEPSGSFASVPSAAELRERRRLADRTTAGESIGNVRRLLEVIALQLLHLTYRAIQTDVRPPPGFVAQEPPPFLRSAYPRLRDVSSDGVPYAMRRGERGDAADPVANLSEREWVEQALARLERARAESAAGSSSSCRSGRNRRRCFDTGTGSGASSLEMSTPRIQTDEMDILREGLPDLLYRCGSTEAVLLDYYALAPYILLTLNPPLPPPPPSHAGLIPASVAWASLARASAASTATAQIPSLKAPLTAPSASLFSPTACTTPAAAPRRTVFRLASSSSPASAPALMGPSAHSERSEPCQRTCTPLQLAILQRGRNPATAQLRSRLFVLPMANFGHGATGSATESGAERPLIPDGDDVDDTDED
ncbi:hypothetical protein LSCM1_03771 [Leishmania martiniquensis]|uniref:Uncharacterized protein n=1 Tax=Leishmania martiniquensis TaxID=1580590 RepID=A0A836KGY4_9TRYP|nr:hypothetical protein LSCM1_03771 [Leishmania martiniquensis]